MGAAVPWGNATPAPAPYSVLTGQPCGTGVLLHFPIAEVLVHVPMSGLLLPVPTVGVLPQRWC